MKIDNFFGELKRRNVYKVAVAYAIVGWLLVQVATQVFPFLEIPNWVVRLVIAIVVIGFPIALVIAWAFELTPEGLKRTEDVDFAASARQPRRHAWIFIVLVGAALSIAVFLLGRYSGRNVASAARTEAATGSSIPQKSIAVLPFENLSDDKGAAYFAAALKIWETSTDTAADQRRRLSAKATIRALAGDFTGAQADGEKARQLLEERLRERPNERVSMRELVWVDLALKRDADALKLARQAVDLLPPERDALLGNSNLAGLAEVEARTGAASDAVAILRRLLTIPAGETVSIARLKIDPVWDPIRNDPGFLQLLAAKEHVGP